MQSSRFIKQLIWLVVLDVILTISDTYVPATLTPARMAGSVVVFIAMATTMIVAVRWMLEDF